MKILVDGVDGVGKTTLINVLADEFHCDVLHMTKNGSKRYMDYWDKSFLNNVVLDRSFFSEVVYSKVFNRQTELSAKRVNTLVNRYKHDKWRMIFLTAETSELLKRLNLRGDEEEVIKSNLDALTAAYRDLSTKYNIPLINVETTTNEEIINIILKG